MSASTEIIIETRAERAADSGARQFLEGRQAGGIPAGGQGVRDAADQVGRQNDEDVIVTGGLKEGDVVTLESPAEAAKRAKKKL